MSLFYKVKKYVNPSNQYNGWYYGRTIMDGEMDLAQIAEVIQRNCSMKKSDVWAVLTELVEVVTDALQDSKKVRINGLGIFRLGLKTTLAKEADDFDYKHIERVHVNFLPEYTVNVDGSRNTVLTDGVKIEQYSEYDRGINDNERQG